MTAGVAPIEAIAGEPGAKGLKGGALGFASSVVIGVSSTAPAYSLASSLGLVVLAVGFQAPAIMIVAFVPMLFIAAAYYYLNRADPDCGTTFSWVTKAMGPWAGWMGGWGIIVADIIVMANLSQIASIYTFSLFGIAAPDRIALLAVGVAWIVVMTLICYIGIEVSARVQVGLLSAEILILGLFAVVALAKVLSGSIPDAVTPTLNWINPFLITDPSRLATGLIVAIFIYWGWDSTVTVNEESANATESPGKAAIVSTLILVATYVIVSIAAQSFHGAAFLSDPANSGDVLGALAADVLGSPWDKLLIIAVLTSASASTQTTILPTARTALSMAAKGAIPGFWARIHPRYLTPSTATIGMGLFSILWYVGLTMISTNVLGDSIAALGLMIAFYYGLTGFACAIFYRRRLMRSAKDLLLIGVLPVAGGLFLTWALVQSVITLSDPACSTCSGSAVAGIGLPVVIAGVFLVVGIVLMIAQRFYRPDFFGRRPEVFDPDIVNRGARPDAMGSGSI